MLLPLIVFTQCFLFICAMLSPLLGASFFGSNCILSALGFWMLETRSVRPAVMYLSVLLFTIVNDCICISFFGVSLYDKGFAGTVSLASSLLALFLKPFMGIVLYQELQKRGGTLNIRGFTSAMKIRGPERNEGRRENRSYSMPHG
mmetsp:Transcript_12747/g.23148  ORF Transcript_12747/g.23148 Transcript_12747/m.23148 type:complete len:146 (+) Transcript_12747:300-737(+)